MWFGLAIYNQNGAEKSWLTKIHFATAFKQKNVQRRFNIKWMTWSKIVKHWLDSCWLCERVCACLRRPDMGSSFYLFNLFLHLPTHTNKPYLHIYLDISFFNFITCHLFYQKQKWNNFFQLLRRQRRIDDRNKPFNHTSNHTLYTPLSVRK